MYIYYIVKSELFTNCEKDKVSLVKQVNESNSSQSLAYIVSFSFSWLLVDRRWLDLE